MEIIKGKIKGAQKVIIYGPEGIGKSTFASYFPNPVFIDTEGSTKHMDVARTPNPSSWSMLLDQIKYFKNNPKEYSTLIIDTADWAERLAITEICAKSQKQGIEDFGYGKGYTYLAEEFGRLLNALEELIELGINVVLTAHAQMRKFEQPDEMGAYDRWELKLQKKTGPMVKEWADMVLFANYKTIVVKNDDKKNKAQGGKRIMHTAHHPCWDAKNRHGLKDELPFDYEEIAHCIPSKDQKPTVDTNNIRQAEDDLKKIIAEDKAETVKEETKPAPTQPEPPKQDPPKPDLNGLPKALADLMAENKVTVEEIQQAVASKGYYPQNTPIANYDPGFIDGVLIGAWGQVFQIIQAFRDDLPF